MNVLTVVENPDGERVTVALTQHEAQARIDQLQREMRAMQRPADAFLIARKLQEIVKLTPVAEPERAYDSFSYEGPV